MKIFFVLLAISTFTVVLSDPTPSTVVDGSPTDSSSISPTETTITSTSTEITTSTVPPSISTVVPLTTSTVVPPTTSTVVPPTTSTVVPPNTTTVAPPNTTTVAPPTTIKPVTPTTDPTPKKCSWNVTAGGLTCIRAEIQAEFIIDNQGSKSDVNLGCDAELLNPSCSSNDTQLLILSEKEKYVLTMAFQKDTDKFSVVNITLDFILPDGTHYFVFHDSEKLFKATIGNSYLCNSAVNINLGNITMKISEIQIQAFAVKDNTNFGKAEECTADDPVSDAIPIAVGVVLVTLVIIVLVAYLIGRRRNRQPGYQTFHE